MEKGCLKITMFGTFVIEYEGRRIYLERNDRTKTNQLLQRLVCDRDGVPREQLWHDLFAEENVANPSNSLRGLLFRLRKSLKEQGLPGEDYVHIRKRNYYFEPDCKIACDVYEFENAWERAEKSTTNDRRLYYLTIAWNLYAGEFLPSIGAAEWAVILNIKYKNMYTTCVKELCEACAQRKEYRKMFEFAQRAATLYPFDGWQTYQMEALMALNSSKEAIQLYERTERFLFKELGVTMPQRMTELMTQLGTQVRNQTDLMSDVIENLRESETKQGAYECVYPSFVECYRLISRMLERTGQTAWLLLCTITDGKGYALTDGERLVHLQQDIRDSISRTLRRGDMFTRYSDNQFLILLMEIKQEDCQKVIDRITANLKNQNGSKYYTYHMSPIITARRTRELHKD